MLFNSCESFAFDLELLLFDLFFEDCLDLDFVLDLVVFPLDLLVSGETALEYSVPYAKLA